MNHTLYKMECKGTPWNRGEQGWKQWDKMIQLYKMECKGTWWDSIVQDETRLYKMEFKCTRWSRFVQGGIQLYKVEHVCTRRFNCRRWNMKVLGGIQLYNMEHVCTRWDSSLKDGTGCKCTRWTTFVQGDSIVQDGTGLYKVGFNYTGWNTFVQGDSIVQDGIWRYNMGFKCTRWNRVVQGGNRLYRMCYQCPDINLEVEYISFPFAFSAIIPFHWPEGALTVRLFSPVKQEVL
jgi:hypothetical protein